MTSKRKGRNEPPSPPEWHQGSTRDAAYSFILRVRVSPTAGGAPRPLFEVEDIATGETAHFTEFDAAARSLGVSVRRILSGLNGNSPNRAT